MRSTGTSPVRGDRFAGGSRLASQSWRAGDKPRTWRTKLLSRSGGRTSEAAPLPLAAAVVSCGNDRTVSVLSPLSARGHGCCCRRGCRGPRRTIAANHPGNRLLKGVLYHRRRHWCGTRPRELTSLLDWNRSDPWSDGNLCGRPATGWTLAPVPRRRLRILFTRLEGLVCRSHQRPSGPLPALALHAPPAVCLVSAQARMRDSNRITACCGIMGRWTKTRTNRGSNAAHLCARAANDLAG
jgi:hypothetical protein